MPIHYFLDKNIYFHINLPYIISDDNYRKIVFLFHYNLFQELDKFLKFNFYSIYIKYSFNNGFINLCKYLIKLNNSQHYLYNRLYYACRNNNIKFVKLLLKYYKDDYIINQFLEAGHNNHIKIVKLLFKFKLKKIYKSLNEMRESGLSKSKIKSILKTPYESLYIMQQSGLNNSIITNNMEMYQLMKKYEADLKLFLKILHQN
jgi:hypothetical protein